MKKQSDKILFLPLYSIIPLLLMLIVNVIAYYGTRLITNSMPHYDFSLSLDNIIPFNRFFIIPYILAYVQWIVGYILISTESRETCYHFISGEIIAKILCLFIFIIFPTTMQRADITGNDLCNNLTKIIYMTDLPDNLFPSIHCLESWICFRGSLKLEKVGKFYAGISLIVTVMVCLSVVFVKQHVVVDIFGGIAVAELGLWLSSKLKAERLLIKINGAMKVRFYG